ncbi:MAG: hypothetical protein J6B89_02190 [Bacilli bacterium]|nr:hypothetical protein [Bacilli bacterium]
MNQEYDRFKLNISDINMIDQKGRKVPKTDTESYLQMRQNNITYQNKLKIGDTVKIKGAKNMFVTVAYVKYNIPALNVSADYAGYEQSSEDNNLKLFNQKDIEFKI